MFRAENFERQASSGAIRSTCRRATRSVTGIRRRARRLFRVAVR